MITDKEQVMSPVQHVTTSLSKKFILVPEEPPRLGTTSLDTTKVMLTNPLSLQSSGPIRGSPFCFLPCTHSQSFMSPSLTSMYKKDKKGKKSGPTLT